jgi:hypothetical protein
VLEFKDRGVEVQLKGEGIGSKEVQQVSDV